MALANDGIPFLEDWLVIDTVDGNSEETSVSLDTEGEGSKGNMPSAARLVEANINCGSGVAEIVESFRYQASNDCSATFKFPLPSKAAVCR